MSRIDQVVITEIYLLAQHPSYEMNFPGLGFGRDPVEAVEDPSPIIGTMELIFHESMALLPRRVWAWRSTSTGTHSTSRSPTTT